MQIYFIDEVTYENEHGNVRDIETGEIVDDYMGWCTACDFFGKVDDNETMIQFEK